MATKIQISRGSFANKQLKDHIAEGELFWSKKSLSGQDKWDEGTLWIGNPDLKNSQPLPIAGGKFLRALSYKGPIQKVYNIFDETFNHVRSGDFYIWQEDAPYNDKDADSSTFYNEEFNKGDILIIDQISLENNGLSNIDKFGNIIDHSQIHYIKISCSFDNVRKIKFNQANGEKWPQFQGNTAESALLELQYEKLQWIRTISILNGIPTEPIKGGIYLIDSDSITFNKNTLEPFIAYKGDFVIWTKDKLYKDDNTEVKEYAEKYYWRRISSGAHSADKISYFNSLNKEDQILVESELRDNNFSNDYIKRYKENAGNLYSIVRFLSINTPQLNSEGKIPIEQLPEVVVGALKFGGIWEVCNPQYTTEELTAAIEEDTSSGTIHFIDNKYYSLLPEEMNPNYHPAKGDYWVVDTRLFQNLEYLLNSFGWVFSSGDWIIYDGIKWSRIDHTNGVRSLVSIVDSATAVENEWTSDVSPYSLGHMGAPKILASHKIGIVNNYSDSIEIVGKDLVNQKSFEVGKFNFYPRYTSNFNEIKNSFLEDIVVNENLTDINTENKTLSHNNFQVGLPITKRDLTIFGNIYINPHTILNEKSVFEKQRSFLNIQSLDSKDHSPKNLRVYVPEGKNNLGIEEKLLEEDISVLLPSKTSTIVGKLPNKYFSKNSLVKSIEDDFIESSSVDELIFDPKDIYTLKKYFSLEILSIDNLNSEQLQVLLDTTKILNLSPEETSLTIALHEYPWVLSSRIDEDTFRYILNNFTNASFPSDAYTTKEDLKREDPPVTLTNVLKVPLKLVTPITQTYELNIGEYDKTNGSHYAETSFDEEGNLISNYTTKIRQNKFQQSKEITVTLPTNDGHLLTQENLKNIIGISDESYIPLYGGAFKIDHEGDYDNSNLINTFTCSPIHLNVNFLRERISTTPSLEPGEIYKENHFEEKYAPAIGDGTSRPSIDADLSDVGIDANIIAGTIVDGQIIEEKSIYATKALGVGNDTHVEGFINPPRTNFKEANQYKDPYTNLPTIAEDVEVDMPNESGVLLTSHSRIVGNENTIQIANAPSVTDKIKIADNELFYDTTDKSLFIGENNRKNRLTGFGSIIWKGILKSVSGSETQSTFPSEPLVGDTYILKENHYFSRKEDIDGFSPDKEISSIEGLLPSEYITWCRGGVILYVDNPSDWEALGRQIGSDSRWNGWVYLNNTKVKDYNILSNFEGIERTHSTETRILPEIIKNLYNSGLYYKGLFGTRNLPLDTAETIDAGTFKIYIGEDIENAQINNEQIFIKKNSIVLCQRDIHENSYINTIPLGYTESGSIDFEFHNNAFLENTDYAILSKNKDQSEKILTSAQDIKTVTQALDWLNREKADLSVNGKIPLTQIPETLIGALQFKSTILLDSLNQVYSAKEFADYLRELYKDRVDDDQHGEDYTLDDGDYVIFTKNSEEDLTVTIEGVKYNSGDWAIYHLIKDQDTFDRINSSASVDNVNGKIASVTIKGDRGIYVDNSKEDIRITSTTLLHDAKGIKPSHIPILDDIAYEVKDSNIKIIPSTSSEEFTDIIDTTTNTTMRFPILSGQVLVHSEDNGSDTSIPRFDEKGKLVDTSIKHKNEITSFGKTKEINFGINTNNIVSLVVSSEGNESFFKFNTNTKSDVHGNNVTKNNPNTLLTDTSIIDCGTWL